jgi:tetratricopeptide (TPR) repeat protein
MDTLPTLYEWINSGIALAALVVSLSSFVTNRLTKKRLNTVEVRQLTNKAWDLLGAEPGTSSVELTDVRDPAQLELAGRQIEEALIRAPRDFRAQQAKGIYALASGKPQEAEKALRKAIRLAQRKAALHVALGNALYFQQRHEESVGAFHEALSIEPDRADALGHLAAPLLALDVSVYRPAAQPSRRGCGTGLGARRMAAMRGAGSRCFW